MKNIIHFGFVSFWIIMSAVGFYCTLGWPYETALFPRMIALAMLGMSIAILVMEIVRGLRQDNDSKADDGAEFKIITLRLAKYYVWLIGFFVFIWAIGIIYSIPIYIFGYMKIEGKYSWLKCGIYTVASTVFISILFEYAFKVGWPEGALMRVLTW